MRRALVALILLSTSTLTAADRLDTPWGTSHGDNHGTQRTTTPTGDWSAGIELAWEFDTRAHGLDRVAARGPLTFDSAGNLYWITSVGTPDGRQVVASVSPAGALRWASAPLTRGGAYTQSAALVGLERIYAIGGGASYDYDGDGTPGRQLLALDKSTGATLWSLDLDGDWDGAGTADHDLGGLGQNGPLTPVLSDGRLFVALIGSAGLHLVQVDAAVGALLCCDLIDPAITWGANDSGHIVHVADVFGPGLDGLFFNLEEGAANDFATGAGLRDVIALRVTPGSGAALAWTAPGGNRARSSLTYSATTGHLYAHTWNDQPVIAGGAPAALTIYDPATGAVLGSANPGFGHGFYDLGALDFDNRSLIAGGPDGRLAVYTDDGTGHLTTRLYLSAAPWHGEYRVFGQIAPGPAGRTLVFTGTNSRVSDLGPGYTARVVVLDASRAQLPSLDDGPACFDDITVQAGADEAAARAAAPLLSENFESGFATIPGPVAQKPGWTDVSGSAASGTPLVVPDPTGAGQGRVLVLDPLGNTAVATRRQGARVALPLPAPNLADEWYAIIRWRQWRADLGDDVEVRSDWNPGVYQWDQSGRIHTAAGWSMDAPLTAGRWQLIELHHRRHHAPLRRRRAGRWLARLHRQPRRPRRRAPVLHVAHRARGQRRAHAARPRRRVRHRHRRR